MLANHRPDAAARHTRMRRINAYLNATPRMEAETLMSAGAP
jgi:hypothetical protein